MEPMGVWGPADALEGNDAVRAMWLHCMLLTVPLRSQCMIGPPLLAGFIGFPPEIDGPQSTIGRGFLYFRQTGPEVSN